MSTVETFITVHDVDLIRECEERSQFHALTSYTYLFVGPRSLDGCPDVPIVVARDFPMNVEQWPQFYDFTGWWILAKHGLIKAEHVMFLQYDMFINDPLIEERVETLLHAGAGPIAFTAGHNLANNFMLIIDGFRETYCRAMYARGVNPDLWPAFNEWPSTQGTAWRRTEFENYMQWFYPFFEIFKNDVWAGHLAERTVKAWTEVRGTPPQYMIGAITHHAKDCHGTGALMAGNRDLYDQRNAAFMYQSS